MLSQLGDKKDPFTWHMLLGIVLVLIGWFVFYKKVIQLEVKGVMNFLNTKEENAPQFFDRVIIFVCSIGLIFLMVYIIDFLAAK